MKVFCNQAACKFNTNEECRTSSISVDEGSCSTFLAEIPDGHHGPSSKIFWGHLSIDASAEKVEGTRARRVYQDPELRQN